jgi:hypothetical protein
MYSRCLFLPSTQFALETPRKAAAAAARLSYLRNFNVLLMPVKGVDGSYFHVVYVFRLFIYTSLFGATVISILYLYNKFRQQLRVL